MDTHGVQPPRSTAAAGPPPPRRARATAPAPPPPPPRFDAGGADAAAATPDWMLPRCARRYVAQVLGRRGGRMQEPCGRHAF